MMIETSRIRTFGLGLALLIPFFIKLHVLKAGLSFGWFLTYFLGGFVVVLEIVHYSARLKPVLNIFLWE